MFVRVQLGSAVGQEIRRVRWTDRMLVITAVLMTWASEPMLQDAFATGRGACGGSCGGP